MSTERSPSVWRALPLGEFSCAPCGIFEVIFPSPVNACVFNATIGDDLADVPVAGLVSVTLRSMHVNSVCVQTFNANGMRTNHAFRLSVQR